MSIRIYMGQKEIARGCDWSDEHDLCPDCWIEYESLADLATQQVNRVWDKLEK